MSPNNISSNCLDILFIAAFSVVDIEVLPLSNTDYIGILFNILTSFPILEEAISHIVHLKSSSNWILD